MVRAVEMDSQLKGVILIGPTKHTKSPHRKGQCDPSHHGFLWECQYESPTERRDSLRNHKFLAQFRMFPRLVPVPGPDLFSFRAKTSVPFSPASMAQATYVVLQEVIELRDDILLLHSQYDKLNCKIHKAEQKLEHTDRWVTDLLDQRPELRNEIWRIEQDVKEKEEKETLEASGPGLGLSAGSACSRILAQGCFS